MWGEAPRNACFALSQYQNWRAADAKTVYLRADFDRVYRLDLVRACRSLLWPDAHLILRARGGDTICSALDLDLRMSPGAGDIPEPCLIDKMTALSPAEDAALPKKVRP